MFDKATVAKLQNQLDEAHAALIAEAAGNIKKMTEELRADAQGISSPVLIAALTAFRDEMLSAAAEIEKIINPPAAE